MGERIEVSNRVLGKNVQVLATESVGEITMVAIDDGGVQYWIEYVDNDGMIHGRWFRKHQISMEGL